MFSSTRWCASLFAVCVLIASPAKDVQATNGLSPAAAGVGADARQIVATTLSNEDFALQHPNRYAYISEERSDRTGGHLWREKVVETGAGKVRMLLEEDGKPLSPEREAAERGRLAQIVSDLRVRI